MNNNGEVVGDVEDTTGTVTFHAFAHMGVGTLTAADELGTFGGDYSIAYGVDNNGEVVGNANIMTGGNSHAFLWTGSGSLLDLNSRVTAGFLTNGGYLDDATAISQNGNYIAAHGTNGDAFLLIRNDNSAAPEPGTLALLLPVALGVIARKRQTSAGV